MISVELPVIPVSPVVNETHPNKSSTLSGLVVAAHGKRFQVELPDGKIVGCVTRGKKTGVACGDDNSSDSNASGASAEAGTNKVTAIPSLSGIGTSVKIDAGSWIFDGSEQECQRPSWNYKKAEGGGLVSGSSRKL